MRGLAQLALPSGLEEVVNQWVLCGTWPPPGLPRGPTTYAGSEMTPIWGVTDGGRKTTGRDRTVLPATVVYDPALTTSYRLISPPRAA
jgi:hypothetical protein